MVVGSSPDSDVSPLVHLHLAKPPKERREALALVRAVADHMLRVRAPVPHTGGFWLLSQHVYQPVKGPAAGSVPCCAAIRCFHTTRRAAYALMRWAAGCVVHVWVAWLPSIFEPFHLTLHCNVLRDMGPASVRVHTRIPVSHIQRYCMGFKTCARLNNWLTGNGVTSQHDYTCAQVSGVMVCVPTYSVLERVQPPPGLRLCVSAGMDDGDVAAIAAALKKASKEVL